MRPDRTTFKTFSVAVLAVSSLTSAVAQTVAPTSSTTAIGAALGAPAQAKIATPAAALSVRAGFGSPAPRDPAALAAAIAAGDVRKALDLGASPADIHKMLKGHVPAADFPAGTLFPDTFLRADTGQFGLGFIDPDGGRHFIIDPLFGDYAPPGGVETLPGFREVYVAQTVLTGGSPQAVAAIFGGAPPQSVAFVQTPNGRVGLWRYYPDGTRAFMPLPGTESFVGYSSLPTAAEALAAAQANPPSAAPKASSK